MTTEHFFVVFVSGEDYVRGEPLGKRVAQFAHVKGHQVVVVVGLYLTKEFRPENLQLRPNSLNYKKTEILIKSGRTGPVVPPGRALLQSQPGFY